MNSYFHTYSAANISIIFICFVLLPDSGDPRSAVQRFSNTHQGVIDGSQVGIAIRIGIVCQIDIYREARKSCTNKLIAVPPFRAKQDSFAT